MVGGAAGDDEDLLDLAEVVVGKPLLVEDDMSVNEVAAEGVGECLRLFGDFLQHEVVVAAFFGCFEVPVDSEGAAFHRVSGKVGDLVAISGDGDDVILTEFDGFPGVFDEGGNVGAEKHLVVADANDERGAPPACHKGAGMVGVGNDEGEGSFELVDDGHDGGVEVSGVGAFAVVFSV